MAMMAYNGTDADLYRVLDVCLIEILALLKPSESDRVKRTNAISELASLLGNIESLKGALVKPFGSFVSNLYTKRGDLDLSIEVSNGFYTSLNEGRKQKLLRDLWKALQRTGVSRYANFISHARVPLVIYQSRICNISCDVSIDNHAGRIKSKVLLWISEIDERLRDMILLTKEWAKAHDVNDPKTGTLNSFSLCMLVIFHLQTCDPPIIPPLKKIYEGNIVENVTGTGMTSKRCIKGTCLANIAYLKSQMSINKSPLSHLLTSFFHKFSMIERLAQEYVISTYTGKWEYIGNNPRWRSKPYSLLIEDPFEQPDNAARAVSARGLNKICNAFEKAHKELSSEVVLPDRNFLLAALVRPDICSQLQTSKNYHHSMSRGITRDLTARCPGAVKNTSIHPQSHNARRANNTQQSSIINTGIRMQKSQQIWRPRYRN